MKALKVWFLNLAARERLLLLVFLVLAVAVWGSSYSGRLGAFLRSYRSTGMDLQEHAAWLARKSLIEADAQKAIAKLDPSQTLDGTKLTAEVTRLAAVAGLTSNVQVDDTRNEASSQFIVHTLRFSVRKADYGSLVRFYQELQKRSPYIGLEQFALQADPGGAATLTATLRISSVEVLKR